MATNASATSSRAIIGGSILLLGVCAAFAMQPRDIVRSSAPSVAPVASVERYACEQAVKAQLRDPDSYQRIEFAGGQDWAMLSFRARNGFGGYNNGYARCDQHNGYVSADLNPGRQAAAESIREEVEQMQRDAQAAQEAAAAL